MTKWILAVTAWMLMASALLAQGVVAGGAGVGMMRQQPWMAPRGQAGPILGKPLSGTETFQNSQALADGTHLDNSATGQFYRDEQGRMRSQGEQSAMIFDPAAGFIYALRTESKSYRQIAVPSDAAWCWTAAINNGGGSSFSYDKQFGPATGPSLANVDGAEPPVTVQLPAQTVNGVWATGTRTTVNIPASAAGNNKPIQIVREVWYSSDLGAVVQSMTSDPRYGTTTYNLTQVQQGAPDPALFQAPAGYTAIPSGPGAGVKK